MNNSTFTSEVSICNQALGWLGADPITSLDDDNTTAELCQLNYPHIRDAVLTEFAWSFAQVEIKSEVADVSPWGDRFEHPVPVGWMQVLDVFKRVDRYNRVPSDGWQRRGESILSLENIIYMWGIQRVTDTSQFSSLFVQCLAARIAADLCIAITQNQEQQGVLWQLYGAKIQEAALSDEPQHKVDVVTETSLTAIRGFGGFNAT